MVAFLEPGAERPEILVRQKNATLQRKRALRYLIPRDKTGPLVVSLAKKQAQHSRPRLGCRRRLRAYVRSCTCRSVGPDSGLSALCTADDHRVLGLAEKHPQHARPQRIQIVRGR